MESILFSTISELSNSLRFDAVVIDGAVERLFHKELKPQECIIIEGGEQAKTVQNAEKLWEAFLERGLGRDSRILSIGGGATSDLTGFAAACYMRGISVSHAPTTLLGMVDAAIGGKTAVNFGGVKNLVGAFHPPEKLLLCPEFLHSLPEKEFRSGIAEVIKYGVICDADFFGYLEENIEKLLKKEPKTLERVIQSSSRLKNRIVMQDEKERGLRAILNYGHTFAHAIESASRNRILHGEAVAVGMSFAAALSAARGFSEAARQDRLIERAGLPLSVEKIPAAELMRLIRRDKKNEKGKIRLILAEKIGKVYISPDVDDNQIERLLIERIS